MDDVFHFNSHARVGRDFRVHRRSADGHYFNSHARVGRDELELVLTRASEISTHTPV